MFYECPECKEPMEYYGGVTELIRTLHLYVCRNCKIELQKEITSRYPIDTEHVH